MIDSVFLLATLAALASGPALYALARERPRLRAAFDGFVTVSIGALILLDVVPETWRDGGPWSLAFLVAGLFGPTLLERGFRHAQRGAHLGALGFATIGLVLHALGDGVVLAPNSAAALQIAVPLHTVPVSMAVWSVLTPASGPRVAAAALGAMAAATVAGFFYGVPLGNLLGARGWAWLQSAIAGSILHVIFGRPHLEGAHEHP